MKEVVETASCKKFSHDFMQAITYSESSTIVLFCRKCAEVVRMEMREQIPQKEGNL